MDLYDKKIMNRMGLPFWPLAKWFKIKIDEKDVEYLVNVIKRDKLYPLINQAYKISSESENSGLAKAYAAINQIVFYDKFYNSSDCPNGMKQILFVYLGLERYYLESFPNILSSRYASVERWFEKITDE